jgi:hypothetical protein
MCEQVNPLTTLKNIVFGGLLLVMMAMGTAEAEICPDKTYTLKTESQREHFKVEQFTTKQFISRYSDSESARNGVSDSLAYYVRDGNPKWKDIISLYWELVGDLGCWERNFGKQPISFSEEQKKSEESPSNASAEALVKQHQSQFNRIATESRMEEGSSNNKGRKKILLQQYPQCLRAVDIKQDSTVKTMHWYAIKNTCNATMMAYWCEGTGCKPTSKAAEIPAGGKEKSWLDTKYSGNVGFQGTACVKTHQGKPVYYNKNKGECWLWE